MTADGPFDPSPPSLWRRGFPSKTQTLKPKPKTLIRSPESCTGKRTGKQVRVPFYSLSIQQRGYRTRYGQGTRYRVPFSSNQYTVRVLYTAIAARSSSGRAGGPLLAGAQRRELDPPHGMPRPSERPSRSRNAKPKARVGRGTRGAEAFVATGNPADIGVAFGGVACRVRR